MRIAGRRALRRATGADPGRQLAAILNERDRTADLGRLAMPTLVLHGDRDQVIVPSGGRATAAAIPGAELLEVPGMGHDLARWVWPTVLDGIARTAARTDPAEFRAGRRTAAPRARPRGASRRAAPAAAGYPAGSTPSPRAPT